MRLDPRRVMFLCSAHGRMPQQFLYSANVATVFQQAAGESVTEPMRSGVHVGDLADPLDGAPEIASDRCWLGFASPEKVIGVGGRQCAEFASNLGRQLDLKRQTSLLHAEKEIVVGAQAGTFQDRRIGTPQAAVEQQQQEGTSTAADVWRLIGIVARYLVASRKHCIDLLLRVRHSGRLIDSRGRNRLHGIFGEQFSLAAPLEEEPKVFQFLSLRGRRDIAQHAPLGYGVSRDLRQRNIWKCSQRSTVAGDGGLADVARRALSQIFSGELLDRLALGLIRWSRERQCADLANRLIPIVGTEAAPPALSAKSSIGPYGAGAECVVLSFALMLARFKMPTIRCDAHRSDVTPIAFS